MSESDEKGRHVGPGGNDFLLRAMDALRGRIVELERSCNPVECVAQGQLDIALHAIEAAADLLGED